MQFNEHPDKQKRSALPLDSHQAKPISLGKRGGRKYMTMTSDRIRSVKTAPTRGHLPGSWS